MTCFPWCVFKCKTQRVVRVKDMLYETSPRTIRQVVRVYDGDTATFVWKPSHYSHCIQASCRLKGIDTPELHKGDERERAVRARDELKRVLGNGNGWVLQVFALDKYGRPLVDIVPTKRRTRRLIAPSCTINAFLVRKGFAHVYHGGKRSAR